MGAFQDMSEAVFYNTLAWSFATDATAKSTFESNAGPYDYFLSLRNLTCSAVSFIQTWFLDSDTAMNPNLDYGQMQRGPDGQNGTHTGVLWVFEVCIR